MDELTFILILAGIGVVLLVAMFTYYKHHKKIKDEIENFNHHSGVIDDVLLNENTTSNDITLDDKLSNGELPGSFTASRNDNFDIDQVNITQDNIKNDSSISQKPVNVRELVDGVYINSKRVVKGTANYTANEEKSPISSHKPTINTFAHENSTQDTDIVNSEPDNQSGNINNHNQQPGLKKIKVVYDPLPDNVDELIISHTVLSNGEFFTAPQLYTALNKAGLSYGEMNIFHYPGDDKAETYALFSVANVIEPGTFDLHDTESMKTPGISLFMRLPTRMAGNKAYEEFIHVAQIIANDLGGELCDETRSQLTQQAIEYKKEQIKKLDFDMAKAQKLADMGH